jgi:hypothetical protein
MDARDAELIQAYLAGSQEAFAGLSCTIYNLITLPHRANGLRSAAATNPQPFSATNASITSRVMA